MFAANDVHFVQYSTILCTIYSKVMLRCTVNYCRYRLHSLFSISEGQRERERMQKAA